MRQIDHGHLTSNVTACPTAGPFRPRGAWKYTFSTQRRLACHVLRERTREGHQSSRVGLADDDGTPAGASLRLHLLAGCSDANEVRAHLRDWLGEKPSTTDSRRR